MSHGSYRMGVVVHAYQYWKATRKASPNTQDDRDSWTFALMMMLSLVLASYAGVKLAHEDWESKTKQ